uniref:Minor capsid protein P8 central region domain-containing protein n=1 Tax=viral metagenome TaxID=1070528 RepID=A0A6C0BKH7_9ZZZZ
MSQQDVIYRNNPTVNRFQQSDSGFGFSNFRNNENTIPTVNRVTTDFQLENEHQYSNPISEYEASRHSNFLYNEHYGDFRIVDQEKVPDDYIYWDIIKTFQERNPLMDFFFSKKNLDHLQKLIITMVHYQSEGAYQISRQNDNELLVVMRSIYIKTPTNPYASGDAFRRDICTLNKNVLDWVVPKILVNVQQYLGFVRDQSNNVRPLARPEFMSSAGNRINRGFDVTFV